MAENLAALHNAYNGGLRLEMPVGCHSFVGRLGLLLCLLQLNLVDLNAYLFVAEVGVVRELVR